MKDRTTEILKRFQTSWNETEAFFRDLYENYEGFGFVKEILELIEELRKEGKNSCFRLGTSIHYLVISRSVDHGLRRDQKCIRIESIEDAGFKVVLRDGDKVYREYQMIDLKNEKLKRLIKTLENTLID